MTPDNLSKLYRDFDGFFMFGSSAISNMVNSGVLRGRPFGGVEILINVNLRSVCTTIDRLNVIVLLKLPIGL